jgi:hypothetical protein
MASIGYKNVVEALDRVFGRGGWRIGTMYLDDHGRDFEHGNDFLIAVTIMGARESPTVYINVVNTLFRGMKEPTPGRVGIVVPNPPGAERRRLAPHGIWVTGIEEIEPSAKDVQYRQFGAYASDVDGIVTHLTVLKRYLDRTMGG